MFEYFFTNVAFSEIFFSVIIGTIQGIAEFLPISSTAHLLIGSKLLVNKDIGLATSNVIQFGTLVAILHFYKLEIGLIWKNIILNITNNRQLKRFFLLNKNWFSGGLKELTLSSKDKYDIIIGQLFVGSIPVILSALIFRKQIEFLRSNLLYIAFFLIAGGFLITVSELWYHRQTKQKSEIVNNIPNNEIFTLKQVLTIGIFQAFSILPGMSRSGSTLAGALFTGRKRSEGVNFSFLLAIPALMLASIFDIIKVFVEFKNGNILFEKSIISGNEIHLSVIAIFIGFMVAWFVGEITLRWLLKYLSSYDSRYFIIYRLLLAVLIIIFIK